MWLDQKNNIGTQSKWKCGAYGIFRLTALDFLYVRLLLFYIVTNYSPFLSISSFPSGRFVKKRYFLTKRVAASIYFKQQRMQVITI